MDQIAVVLALAQNVVAQLLFLFNHAAVWSIWELHQPQAITRAPAKIPQIQKPHPVLPFTCLNVSVRLL
jgi:hypothetical protein